MPPYSLAIDGRIVKIILEGSFDLSNSVSLKNDVEQLISSESHSVYVIGSGITYIDSSGVASLLFIRRLCERFGCKLVFESISSEAMRVIELANLGGILRLNSNSNSKPQATNVDKANRTLIEPKFSDSEALAIFQNDLDSATSTSENSNTFQIKPGSFS